MNRVTVEKRNHLGQISFTYDGELLEASDTHRCIVATFGRPDVDAGYVVFRKGDIMTEWFFSDRWYNIFRLQDVDSGTLKGWYCNITRPAQFGEGLIAADDLALDVFIAPDGTLTLLDEDEFAALALSADEQAEAWAAVADLRARAERRAGPFAEITAR